MESFGSYIKAEREKKGISLKEISNVTKISHHVLEALESDHVEEFPYPAFAKGFLHTYAKQLGLNSNEIVSRYVDFVTHIHLIDKNRVLFDERKQLGRVGFDQNKILTKAERMQGRRVLPAFLIIILIIGVWFAWSIFLKQTSLSMHSANRGPSLSKKIEILHAGLPEIEREILDSSETEEALTGVSSIINTKEGSLGVEEVKIASIGIENRLMGASKIEESLMDAPGFKKIEDEQITKEKHYNAEDQEEDIISSESSSIPLFKSIPDAQIPARQTYQKIGPKKELIVSAMEQTWMDIAIDDTTNYDFILYPGDTIKLEAQSKFSLLIGNAGGITFTYEGETFGPIGEHGKVVRLNLPK